MRVLKHFLLCWFFLASMAFGQSVAHKELYDALHLEKIADILRREGIEDGLKTGEVYLGQSYDVTSCSGLRSCVCDCCSCCTEAPTDFGANTGLKF